MANASRLGQCICPLPTNKILVTAEVLMVLSICILVYIYILLYGPILHPRYDCSYIQFTTATHQLCPDCAVEIQLCKSNCTICSRLPSAPQTFFNKFWATLSQSLYWLFIAKSKMFTKSILHQTNILICNLKWQVEQGVILG